MDKVAVQETLPPCHELYKEKLVSRTHMVPMQRSTILRTSCLTSVFSVETPMQPWLSPLELATIPCLPRNARPRKLRVSVEEHSTPLELRPQNALYLSILTEIFQRLNPSQEDSICLYRLMSILKI